MTTYRPFHLHFLESPTGRALSVLLERSLVAADLDAAIRAASNTSWPTGAHACRLTDFEGREVAYRFGACLDGRPATIVKFT